MPLLGLLLAAILPLGASALAQQAPSAPSAPGPHDPRRPVAASALPSIGSAQEDSARLAAVRAGAPGPRLLLRSPSALVGRLPGPDSTFRWGVVLPEVLVTHNDTLPFALNTGNLWAGRGLSAMVRGGVRMDWRWLHAVLAPELVHEQNLPFLLPYDGLPEDIGYAPRIPPGVSPFANPFYAPFQARQADVPVRMGGESRALRWGGQSAIWASIRGVDVGVGSENHWWGPGIRNALVLSSNAPGFGHLFVRPSAPVRTRIGEMDARWLRGALVESEYFDSAPANDLRALGAFALAWRPRWTPDVTVGFTRATYAGVGAWSSVVTELASDVVNVVGPGVGLTRGREPRDMIWSLFGRWAFPADGAEVYGEIGRHEPTAGLRDALIAPHHSRGYTLGFQWTRPVRTGWMVRLQGERTNTEQTATHRSRPVGTWYASSTVAQGYTNRGRVLGASIGPSGSSWWLAGDAIGRRLDVGTMVYWYRWNDDAQYSIVRDVSYSGYCEQDVSVGVGMRGAFRTSFGTVTAAYQPQRRLNPYNRHFYGCPDVEDRIYNRSLQVGFVLAMPGGRR